MHPPPTDELQARRTPRTSKQLTIDEPATKSLLYPKAAWEISSNPMWAPAAREGHSAVYSTSLNQLFLFGTYDLLKKGIFGLEREDKISAHQSLTLGMVAC